MARVAQVLDMLLITDARSSEEIRFTMEPNSYLPMALVDARQSIDARYAWTGLWTVSIAATDSASHIGAMDPIGHARLSEITSARPRKL